MSILKFLFIAFLAPAFTCTIDLTPYLNTSFATSNEEVGAHPVILDYSYETFNQTFAEFIPGNDLETLSDTLKEWFPEFLNSDWVGPWKSAGYKFGIFSGRDATHKKQRLIKGINCKMCHEFIEWIRENKTISPPMERLLMRLDQIDAISQKEFSKVMEGIADLTYLYNGKRRLPVTLRIIRFERSDAYALPLHFDISVLSLIFPNNDTRFSENLIMAPADGRPFQVLDLRRALRPVPVDTNKTCGLLIAGSQIPQLTPHIYPSPHGVLPHGRGARCVIVACLHLPNCDTSKKTALLPKLTEIPNHLLDPFEEMEKVPPGALIVLDIGGTLLKKENEEWVLTDSRWTLATNRAEKVVALTKKPPSEEISQARQQTLQMHGIACTIIESSSTLKGPRLAAYIETLDTKPTMILYVDDKTEQIESVHQTCREFGIPYKSIHYLGPGF